MSDNNKEYIVSFFSPQGFFGPPIKTIILKGTNESVAKEVAKFLSKSPRGTTMEVVENDNNL